MSTAISNVRPEPDGVLVDIADYALTYQASSREAIDTARYNLIDTLGCGLEALEYPACRKLLGPIVPGTVVPNGARVPGTQFQILWFVDPAWPALVGGQRRVTVSVTGTYIACEPTQA